MWKRYIWISLGSVLVLAVAIAVFMTHLSDTRSKEMLKGYDTSQSGYDAGKLLSTKAVFGVLNINSQDDYTKSMTELKTVLSEELYKEYFPSNDYIGASKGYEAKLIGIYGTLEPVGDMYKYRVKANLEYTVSTVPVEFLVTVQGSRVMRLESLGVQGESR